MIDPALWPDFAGMVLAPLTGGLINATWRVGEPPVGVLQRLHPIFTPEVNADIEAVTSHVAAKGLLTPRPLRVRDGGLWVLDEQGRCWRALSWVPGVTLHRLGSTRQAHEAGALVGRWHRAVDDLDHTFAFSRAGVHDTEAHLRRLSAALEVHRDHRLWERVAPVADEILARFGSWKGRLEGPERLAHGDLKVSNLRFDAQGGGLCLLDLDTLGWLPVDLELGDAWRSWCNAATEDHPEAAFDLALFEASARGYLAVHPLPAEDLEALPGGIERICLELSARFCADALAESYFGWDPAVAPTWGEHNLLRAQGQLDLARAVRRVRADLERILGRPGQ